ncbi:Dabb family protein [Demequina sp. SYSU T00039]|uniref:Dabb family protein n=1 Tax=Demequina lignilytica TaxID=3051663 RepID=A0AAW7M234_9MICO|nr:MULTISPECIES: Dabb family protein [unclassified Demequina]MDN4477069.1 Dabb family protein [Demequina sp. SYSU T00039-1]MDN4487242.1 Dabb family protein [Demequina sp. SYSU T00039]MDN4491493.1 Dabb family protein [Demequina sp. SYSU T00068]
MTTDGRIVHVVLVDWRDGMPAAELERLHTQIGLFRAEIPGIAEVTVGPSVSPEGLEAGYGWGLVVAFVDAAARDVYLDHPVHAVAAEIIGAWSARLVVVDLAAR